MKVKGTIFFVILAAAGMIVYSQFLKKEDKEKETQLAEVKLKENQERLQKTDLTRFKAELRIGLDNYLGYYPLRSAPLQQKMLNEGYKMTFEDDGGDYTKRAKSLRTGDLDFAVFTIDSYLLNATPQFSGQVVMVISESKGADAIVAKKEIKSINDLKHVTATLNSPSHQLVKASIIDFGLDELKDNIRPANGSSAALADLLSGKTDAAALWEPDVSAALKDGRFKTLISTDSTAKLIVDVLIASDEIIHDHPERLDALLKHYFPTLKYYLKNPSILTQAFQKDAQLSEEAAQKVANSIAWMSLEQNAGEWFGIRSQQNNLPRFKIIETMDLTNDILIKFGDFKTSPLPSQGAFKLLSSGPIADLYSQLKDGKVIKGDEIFFTKLSPIEWQSLDEVGSLRIKPITFKQGTNELSDEAILNIKNIQKILERYPRYRLSIEGHTSTRGDKILNQELSQARADAIKIQLIKISKIPTNRVRAIGLGGDRPLIKSDSESYRAWQSKLSRVEFHIMRETY